MKYLFTSRKCLFQFSSLKKHNIAFIGLGNMGLGMAVNLQKTGQFNVFGYDKQESALKALQASGATTVSNLSELSKQCTHYITMLPNYKIVGEVLEKDLFLNAPKNSLFIDCSTISPLEAQVLHKVSVEKGHKFVDAPVSGGVKAARDAKLTFMVGTGSQPLFEEVKEVLKFMGANVIMTGANSAGQIAKACNNMALAIEMIGISEAMNLGKQLGIDSKVLAKIVNISSGRCWTSDTYNPCPGVMEGVPSSNNYEGGFASELMLKDLGIAVDAAEKVNVNVNLGKLSKTIYENVVKQGLAKKDFSVVYDLIDKKKL